MIQTQYRAIVFCKVDYNVQMYKDIDTKTFNNANKKYGLCIVNVTTFENMSIENILIFPKFNHDMKKRNCSIPVENAIYFKPVLTELYKRRR